MSDSGKLRLTYGLIAYFSSFLALAALLVLSILCGFKILSEDFIGLILLLLFAFIALLVVSIYNFYNLYNIGKKEN